MGPGPMTRRAGLTMQRTPGGPVSRKRGAQAACGRPLIGVNQRTARADHGVEDSAPATPVGSRRRGASALTRLATASHLPGSARPVPPEHEVPAEDVRVGSASRGSSTEVRGEPDVGRRPRGPAATGHATVRCDRDAPAAARALMSALPARARRRRAAGRFTPPGLGARQQQRPPRPAGPRARRCSWRRSRSTAGCASRSRTRAAAPFSRREADADGGFGLQLVECDRRLGGASAHARGTLVWFELPAGGHPASLPRRLAEALSQPGRRASREAADRAARPVSPSPR